MGCSNCNKPTIEPRRVRPVFQAPTGYTGCALSSLRDALPPPMPDSFYDLPHIADDGSIIYAERYEGQPTPPAVHGYHRNSDDPWRFHPLWTECAMRIHGTSRNRRNGTINIIMICNHPQHPKQGIRLAHTDCNECLLRLPRNDRQ